MGAYSNRCRISIVIVVKYFIWFIPLCLFEPVSGSSLKNMWLSRLSLCPWSTACLVCMFLNFIEVGSRYMFTAVIFFFLLVCAVLGYLLFYVNFKKASEVLLQKSYLELFMVLFWVCKTENWHLYDIECFLLRPEYLSIYASL